MTDIKRSKAEHIIEAVVHIATWLFIFASPLFFRKTGEATDWGRYLHGSVFPLTTCAVFYANYLLLVPRLIFAKRYRTFLFCNLLLISLLTILHEVHTNILFPPHQFHLFQRPPRILFILRGILTYVFIVGISVSIRLSKEWRKAEMARHKAELGRSEAELKNLKNQLNPHFLLNTLNNIYALTAFDPEKAQEAIRRLSQLLRYVLYENRNRFVSLAKEAEFLQTYIALMRIRLQDNVEVTTDIDIPAESCPQVTPLIFISVVENAFKHGVSPTQPSFIHFSLKASETEKHGGVYCASAVGEVNVTTKMKECGALIGGEGNGGVIYPALHYGRDAMVGVALFLTNLAYKKCRVSELLKTYPQYCIAKNKIELSDSALIDKILNELKNIYSDEDINDIDGVKISFEDRREWVHLRRSNTEPIIRIYAESQTMESAEKLAEEIIAIADKIIKG